jgi:hypothetical protein
MKLNAFNIPITAIKMSGRPQNGTIFHNESSDINKTQAMM